MRDEELDLFQLKLCLHIISWFGLAGFLHAMNDVFDNDKQFR